MFLKLFGVQVLLGALIIDVQSVPLHATTDAHALTGTNANLWATIAAETDLMNEIAAEAMITETKGPVAIKLNKMPTPSTIRANALGMAK